MSYSILYDELSEAGASEEETTTNSIVNKKTTSSSETNPTLIKLEEIKENLRKFALNAYTKEELAKLYPKFDRAKWQQEYLESYMGIVDDK
jgi:hypothetical protein